MKHGASIHQAFEELRFGPARTLNLRESLPTRREAVRRAESWLREKQVHHAGADVLIITGRGSNSVGQVPVVREEIRRLLAALARRGVVASAREHTAGSFVVRLAPLRALLETPRRVRDAAVPPLESPAAFAGLDARTRQRLRELAIASLEGLGMRDTAEAFVIAEMQRQFTTLAAMVPAGPSRERLLHEAIERALAEFRDSDR